MKRLDVIFTVVFLLILPVGSLGAQLKTGDIATDFGLRPILASQGKRIVWLESAFKMKGAVKNPLLMLTFFASYCKPCHAEIDIIKDLHLSYSGKGMAVILVVVDMDEPGRRKAATFLKEKKPEFPCLKLKVPTMANVYLGAKRTLPAIYLIDAGMKIVGVYHHLDQEGRRILSKHLNKLLGAADETALDDEGS